MQNWQYLQLSQRSITFYNSLNRTLVKNYINFSYLLIFIVTPVLRTELYGLKQSGNYFFKWPLKITEIHLGDRVSGFWVRFGV